MNGHLDSQICLCHLTLCSPFLTAQTEAAGTLSIKFKWFRNNAHTDENYQYCDSYWDECDSSFYACTDPSIECSRADISGNHGSHHESNVDEGEFQNNNPFTTYYPVSGDQITWMLDCTVSMIRRVLSLFNNMAMIFLVCLAIRHYSACGCVG